MFGFLAKLETLSTTIQELVTRVGGLSKNVEGLLVNLNEEISDDFPVFSVKSVTLENGDTFGAGTVYSENGLLYITAGDKKLVTTLGFVAEL